MRKPDVFDEMENRRLRDQLEIAMNVLEDLAEILPDVYEKLGVQDQGLPNRYWPKGWSSWDIQALAATSRAQKERASEREWARRLREIRGCQGASVRDA